MGEVTAVVAGLTDDPPITAVVAALRALGLPVLFVDLGQPGVQVTKRSILTPEGPMHHSALTGFYLRGAGATCPSTAQMLRDWAEAAPPSTRVVNRWAGAATNLSKPLQAIHITRSGFDTPASLLTTDPQQAREFICRHGKVIVKSTSAVRSIVRLVSVDEDFSAVAWCPTQFQAHVPGVEYRVHVVGNQVFSHRVHSQAVDYRYGGGTVSVTLLPPEVEQRCVALTRQLGLELAGLDLRHTPDGRWVCFEANTSPAWTCYDAGGFIADALARHLSRQGAST